MVVGHINAANALTGFSRKRMYGILPGQQTGQLRTGCLKLGFGSSRFVIFW